MTNKANYVLYREDSNTHKEVYYVGEKKDGGISIHETTDDPRKAKHFPSARAGYEFGDQEGLLHWRVGIR